MLAGGIQEEPLLGKKYIQIRLHASYILINSYANKSHILYQSWHCDF